MRLTIVFTLLFALACSPPPQRRHSANFWNSYDDEDPYEERSGNPYAPGIPGMNIPSGAEKCGWSPDGQNNFSYFHKHLSPNEDDHQGGRFNICKSGEYLFFQAKSNLSQVCFFAINIDQGGSTFPTSLGGKSCVKISDPKNIYKIKLKKDRLGENYATMEINGVMIIRNKEYPYYGLPFSDYDPGVFAPTLYITCNMYLPRGNDAYCRSFTSAGHFVQHSF